MCTLNASPVENIFVESVTFSFTTQNLSAIATCYVTNVLKGILSRHLIILTQIREKLTVEVFIIVPNIHNGAGWIFVIADIIILLLDVPVPLRTPSSCWKCLKTGSLEKGCGSKQKIVITYEGNWYIVLFNYTNSKRDLSSSIPRSF